MAQINTTVGDFSGKTRKILEAAAEAGSLGGSAFSLSPNLLSAAIHRRTSCLSRSPISRRENE
ncbi:hypothetical protein ACFLWS_00745 [Chloroflexota bacterium]